MAIATPKFGGFFVRGYMIKQDIMGVGDRHFTFQVVNAVSLWYRTWWPWIILDVYDFCCHVHRITRDDLVFWRNPTEIIVNSDAWIILLVADIWYTPWKLTWRKTIFQYLHVLVPHSLHNHLQGREPWPSQERGPPAVVYDGLRVLVI